MLLYSIDIQRGVVSGPTIDHLKISGQDMALLYWARLGVPVKRIASALGLSESKVPILYESIAERLNVQKSSPKDALAVMNFRMRAGIWPRPETPWSDRHAITILRDGLFAEGLEDRLLVTAAGEGKLRLFEVADLVARIRAGLTREGVGRGSYVALDATQCFETMIISSAVLLQGATIVRLAENSHEEMLRECLRAAPAQMTFSAQLGALSDLPEAGRTIDLGGGDFKAQHFVDWLDHCTAEDLPFPNVSPIDAAFVGFTSGTTGKPKTILNTHEALWRSSEVGLLLNDFGPQDVFCSATDIVSMGSFRSMVTWPLMSGGQVLFLSPEGRTSPLAQALECKSHKVSVLTAVPNVVRGFVQAAERFAPLPDLRTVIVESGILDTVSKTSFTGLFGIPVTDIYGKRETNHLLRSDPRASSAIGVGGGSMMEVMVRVLDPSGAPVSEGEDGELYVMTDCLALDTANVTIGATEGDHKGWHPTGDLGSVNPDGQVVVSGRLTEIIKTSDGQLLTPLEIESVLMSHAKVLEASVFSVVGNDGIEEIGAAVQVESTDDIDNLEWALREHVQGILGHFKTPKNILVFDDLPRVARQKPDQRALRSAYLAAFDLTH